MREEVQFGDRYILNESCSLPCSRIRSLNGRLLVLQGHSSFDTAKPEAGLSVGLQSIFL